MRQVPSHFVRLIRWLARRAHGLYKALGIFLSAALVVALLAIWGLAELAQEVMGGNTRRFDEAILRWMNSHASGSLDRMTLQVTSIGNGPVVVVIGLTLAAFLWVMRHRLAVLLLVMALAGSTLGHWVLKEVFSRPRPELFVIETPFARPVSASFPSGHATGAMALYLVVAYLLGRLGGRGWFRVGASLIAALLVLAIGLSRIYLGVHYPSDVIAGYIIGFTWVTFCIGGYEAVQLIRKRAQVVTDAPPTPDAPRPA